MLRTIADPNRRKILSLLRQKKEVNASEVEEYIKLAQPTTSHHLRVLVKAKLVTSRNEGTWVYYKLNKPASRNLKILIREL